MYPLDGVQLGNAIKLLEKINALFVELEIVPYLTSGYRPGHWNKAAGGSEKSAHLSCEAIDIDDQFGKIKKKITLELLEKYDLYMEDGSKTLTWIHLQTRKTRSGKRIFLP
jgi:uncharacterized protein YcbK (DUF882 family)